MLPRKTLIIFSLVAATSFAHRGHASLWGERVFPDDESRFSSHAKCKVEDSGAKRDDINHDTVCRTEECKQIADEFLSTMNKSIDPCHDFYDFACGILETEPEPSDIRPVRQAKKWFRSCMDTEALEEIGVTPIESILIRAGGWPISMEEEEWDSVEYTWQNIERNYALLTGSYTFYDAHAIPLNDRHRKYVGFTITPQHHPLSDKLPLLYHNYTRNEYDAYVDLISGVADLFVKRNQADVSEKKVIEEAKDIVEFEKKIYKLQNGSEWKVMSFEEFNDWYDTNVTKGNEHPESKIDWRSIVQSLFDLVNIEVDPQTNVELTNLRYIKGIGDLLKETPPRTIVNYIHWNFIGNMLPYTNEDLRNRLFKLVSDVNGIKKRPERWLECAEEMKMEHAAGYAFVKKYFSKQTETAVRKMIENIQIEMDAQIEKSNWLDEESKILVKDKLNSMKIFVGLPDWYKKKKAVNNFYKGLNVGTEYFDNLLSYMRFAKKLNLKSYARDREVHPLDLDPISVIAYYRHDINAINLPAAGLQSPLFTPHLPENVNYGMAGFVVGHEMGHGFDALRIHMSKYFNDTELSESMLKNYSKRADCFIDQYNKYYGETRDPETTEIMPNSKETVSSKSKLTWEENIADSIGMQVVFEAYQKHRKSETSLKLPGLEEFTDDQLFFLSYASSGCEMESPEYLYRKKYKGLVDTHSPGNLRVIGSVSNTKGFAEVFNCPLGSPMNPINKCSIWGKSDVTPQTVLPTIKRDTIAGKASGKVKTTML